MNAAEFWNIVDRVHAASGGGMDDKCRLLQAELESLPDEAVHSFGEHFTKFFFDAYKWDLWGAAFVMDNGCGDDSFMDFRSTLISMGSRAYQMAMSDPDSLAEWSIPHPTYEGYQYVPDRVYEAKTGREIAHGLKHPHKPLGVRWDEWNLESKYPRLAAKYGFRDADWVIEKERHERRQAHYQKCLTLAQLILGAKVIPKSGKIPPEKVTRNLMRTGSLLTSSGSTTNWEPFDLSPEDYWGVVSILENMTAEQLIEWPGIASHHLKIDPTEPKSGLYADWLKSLVDRGVD